MKVLIIVDAQNDFCHKDGALSSPEAVAAIPLLCESIHQFKEDFGNKLAIFATADTHHGDYSSTLEGKKLPVPHCMEDTWGHYIHDDVVKAVKDDGGDFNGIIDKPTFGSFDLLNALWELEMNEAEPIDEIAFVGFCTDICVVSNALMVRAAFPDVEINVIKDCCAGVTPSAHEAALTVMSSCQINII